MSIVGSGYRIWCGLLMLLLLGLMSGLSVPSAHSADPRLVPDVSSRNIDIEYRFTGEELLLFGAILYPRQRVPEEKVDIVVTLKGPPRAIVLREKQRVAGIWVNADSLTMRSMPGYYAIGSSAPISEILDERTAAIFELGLDNLHISPVGFSTAKNLKKFEQGLIDLYRRNGLFYENPTAVEISEDVLYRARIPIPAQVPTGTYQAETYLISKGRVLAVAARDVTIRKIGFERTIALAAKNNGLAYGLASVFLSLMMGYIAAVLFRPR